MLAGILACTSFVGLVLITLVMIGVLLVYVGWLL